MYSCLFFCAFSYFPTKAATPFDEEIIPLQCGVISPSQAASSSSLQGVLGMSEKYVTDRFGNTYPTSSPFVNMGGFAPYCTTDLFELFVQPGLGDEYTDVACEVLAYLTNTFGTNPGNEDCPPGRVRIYLSYFDDPSSSIGAAATPYYDGPGEGCPKVVYGRPFLKLNGGVDGATSIPFEADGRINVNLSPNGLSYNTNSSIPTPITQYDLYTTLLHETMHLFGFSSSMYRNSSTSNFRYYTAWDRALHLEKNATSHPFIIGGCEDNCWNRNTDVFSSFSQAPCGNDDCITVLWDTPDDDPSINFRNPSLAPVPGFADGEHELGLFLNSLSHVGGYEGDQADFLMTLTRNNGPTGDFRQLSSVELDILCELGINIPANTDCDACLVIANRDNTYTIYNELECDASVDFFTCTDEPFLFIEPTFSTLIENDFLVGSSEADFVLGNLEVVGDVFASPTFDLIPFVTVTETTAGYIIECPYNGIIEFAYTIYSDACECKPHTSTFWIAFDHCTTCNEDVCDSYLCETDFEDIIFPPGQPSLGSILLGHPFLFTDPEFLVEESIRNQNTPDAVLDQTTDNQYLQFGNVGFGEGLALELIAPFESGGCDLQLTVDISTLANDNALQIWGSSQEPCIPPTGTIPTQCGMSSQCDGYTFDLYCLAEMPINSVVDNNSNFDNPQFQTQSIIFPYDEEEPLRYLILTQEGGIFVYIDNLTLRKYCSPDFVWEGECAGEVTSFTADLPELPNITHSWTFGDGAGTSSLVNPSYTFSTPGNYEVTHVVTDDCNRTTEATSTVTIEDCGTTEVCDCDGLLLSETTYPNFTVSNLVAVGALPPNQLNLGGNCLTINGNLIIDQNYTMVGGEIFMEAEASITVNGTHSLDLIDINEGDGIHGCEYMWQGITVEPNARLSFVNNQISDAIVAITAKGQS
ncbi:MAG: PKD domain-containing protein, partial [Bacteroidota bacterium]